MKKPIINQYQRFEMQRDSFYVAGIKLNLAFLYFRREFQRAIDNDLKNIKKWISTLKSKSSD